MSSEIMRELLQTAPVEGLPGLKDAPVSYHLPGRCGTAAVIRILFRA